MCHRHHGRGVARNHADDAVRRAGRFGLGVHADRTHDGPFSAALFGQL
jgi:hypothetical protein